MIESPEKEWAHMKGGLNDTVIKVFHDDKFLVQVRQEKGCIRLCINKKKHSFIDGRPIWEDGITWDELQQIKNKCGFKDKWLCEYYPPEDQVVNVANIRHLWAMDAQPEETL